MITQSRTGIDQSKPEINLSGTVECDEVYVTAGHIGDSGQSDTMYLCSSGNAIYIENYLTNRLD